MISRVQAEFERCAARSWCDRGLTPPRRAPADIDTALVGDRCGSEGSLSTPLTLACREITMPVLSAFALKPAKVASATAVPQMTKKRKTPAPALPAAAEEAGNGEVHITRDAQASLVRTGRGRRARNATSSSALAIDCRGDVAADASNTPCTKDLQVRGCQRRTAGYAPQSPSTSLSPLPSFSSARHGRARRRAARLCILLYVSTAGAAWQVTGRRLHSACNV